MLKTIIVGIEEKKAQLDRLRPLSGSALAQLQKHYDVDLTYTSNAIEGNTLSLRETAGASSTHYGRRQVASRPSRSGRSLRGAVVDARIGSH